MSNKEFFSKLKSMYSKKSVTLYHGSGIAVDFPEVRRSKYTKDFSWGFYCTNSYEQAKRWSKHRQPEYIVNVYSYTEDPALNILKFEDMTEEWLDFIIMCRSGKIHGYDIVEGPMADDTIWNAIGDYMDDNISRDVFWGIAKFRYPTHQISFYTLRAISCLKFERSEKV